MTFKKNYTPWNKGKENLRKTINCLYCKNDFKTYKGQSIKYCSKKCMAKCPEWLDKQSKSHKGQIAWNYIDGRSKLLAPGRYGEKWADIRLLVYKRDNYRCKDCNKTMNELSRALDVHHIIPFLISKDNSLKNLISLCRKCHMKREHKLMKELKQQRLKI